LVTAKPMAGRVPVPCTFAMAFFKEPLFSMGLRNYEQRAQVYGGFWGKFNQSKNFPEIAGKQIRAYFDFKTEAGEKIKIKFALSPVSMDGALSNMKAEVPGWDFDKVKQDGQQLWEKELHKITISGSEDTKKNFYTSMYHTMINPTVIWMLTGNTKALTRMYTRLTGL
jgi:putative alpha-1,2-mannosidase